MKKQFIQYIDVHVKQRHDICDCVAVVVVQTMNILIVNQSVIDLCASFFTLLTATVEVDGNKHVVPMRPLATITVACRGGRHSQVTGQHPRSVSVPHLARETTSSPRPLYFYGR